MVLRFGNSIFEPLWNRNYIDHVQITCAEEVKVVGEAATMTRLESFAICSRIICCS